MTEDHPPGKLHICFSCQHYPNLELQKAVQICVEKHNEEDIENYVLSQLHYVPSTEVPAMIIRQSAGIFMWAYLVVERVKTLYSRGFSEREIEDSMAKIPGDLEKLYEDMFSHMLGNEKSLRLIWWICFAKRRLTLKELSWAMFIKANPSVKSLKDCESARDFPCDCAGDCNCNVMERKVKVLGQGLVEITGSNDNRVVQFIHQSVRKFFLEKNALVRLYNSTSKSPTNSLSHVAEEAERSMAKTCVKYCNMEELVAVSGINTNGGNPGLRTAGGCLQKKYPFLHYAITSWANNEDEMGSQVAKFSSQRESDVLTLLSTAFPEISERRVMTRNPWFKQVRNVIARRSP